MKLVAALAFLLAACGGSSSTSDAGASYSFCPQHRVEGVECPAPASASPDASPVLMKNGFRCASCAGLDEMGHPTEKPVDCKTIAGNDLCVASCGECS
jgi:hypothetical protein